MNGGLVVLSGGVGGAKFVDGLYRLRGTRPLTVIVNTGDDFRHIGLHVSPDIDTVLYTLSGKANRAQGWGREGETWRFMAALRELGGEDWFQLGDMDLALHVLRTRALDAGEALSSIIDRFARGWEIKANVLPMSDDPVATIVETDEGVLPFQHYFVARRCEPVLTAVRFDGADQARPAPGVQEALAGAEAIFIAPSNPYLSIDPILAVPGMAAMLGQARAPVVAISPIVGGQSVKGPTAKIMRELGIAISNQAIADHYAGLIDGMVTHSGDPVPTGLASAHTDTLMVDEEGRCRVAECALSLARGLVP